MLPGVYRMKDLCERTGLDRQAIHFYIREGLLPEGKKTGRNTAEYGEAHLERLALVKKLQHERFLPLRVIKAILDEREAGYTAAQRASMAEVKDALPTRLKPAPKKSDVRAAAKRAGVDARDLAELESLGLGDESWLVELWGEAKTAGFTRERGFSPTVLAIYEAAVERMFREETRILQRLLSELPPADVAALVERSLPLVHRFIARSHEAKVRAFFEGL